MKRVLLFLALTGLLFTSAAARADHGNNKRVHWGKSNVKVVDSVQAAWEPELATGVTTWNTGVDRVTLTVVTGTESSSCKYLKGKVRVCNGPYGTSGAWTNVAGMAKFRYSLPSRHILKAKILLNDTYVTTDALQQAVTNHELGHVLGLDHRGPAEASCMRPAADPAFPNPDAHDYEEVNRLHQHLPHGATARIDDDSDEVEVTWRMYVR